MRGSKFVPKKRRKGETHTRLKGNLTAIHSANKPVLETKDVPAASKDKELGLRVMSHAEIALELQIELDAVESGHVHAA